MTSISAFQLLACPLDGAPLQRSGATWRCAAGHCFDIASQGYSNLLPVHKKRSLDPGDSKAMVAARRRFLAAGHYQPIAEAVSRALFDAWPAHQPLAVLDAGCGEGYYLRELARAAGKNETPLTLLGLDISKAAILAAAKLDKSANWVVASNANLPVQSATLDRLLCLFGFPVYREFARVLKPAGSLLQVDAGADHLRELREIIYPRLKTEGAARVPSADGFELLRSETLRSTLELGSQTEIADLLAMTPHLYRASTDGRARAAALKRLTLTVEIRLTRFGLASASHP